MKTPVVENIVITTLKRMLSEQAEQPSQQTNDNAESDSQSLFTPAEERFLGKFDAYGSRTLGVIYSLSDAGIREFIARSGKDLNLTPEILMKLIKDGIVKIQKYGGSWRVRRRHSFSASRQYGAGAGHVIKLHRAQIIRRHHRLRRQPHYASLYIREAFTQPLSLGFLVQLPQLQSYLI